MKLAFCLFKYFPYGGLQRDFLQIAKKCCEKGHEIHVYTRSWEGEIPKKFIIHQVNKKLAMSNMGKDLGFIKNLQPLLKQHQPDLVIGFNKMPNLDIYFASDNCYAEKISSKLSFFKMITRRHRNRLLLESSLFTKQTKILLIAPKQKVEFTKHYLLLEKNTYFLPPGIDEKLKIHVKNNAKKNDLIKELKLSNDTFLVLMVGSSFKTKGVDRSLQALSSLPKKIREKTHLIIVGKGNKTPFEKLAKKLNISNNVSFMGVISEVSKWYLGCDMLLHPSYFESAGKVLLEACVVGLPVLTTENCGYAFYIKKAKSGLVTKSPFCQKNLNQLFLEMRMTSNISKKWGLNGREFARTNDLYSQHDTAVSIIEKS